MLIILMLFLIISSILVLLVKRNKETFYIFGMCISLAVLITGIMLYVAKKGGISTNLQDFYFFTPVLRSYAQYFLITLNALGYMVAIGRYLFPLFLCLLAIHYSGIEWFKRNNWVTKLVFLPPIISLAVYYPAVFRYLTEQVDNYNQMISIFSLIWVFAYLFFSVTLLVVEAFSIQIKIFQSRFMVIVFFIFSIIFFYLLYFGQDPIQIYQFYFWANGIYYMNAVLSVPAYLALVLINIVLAIIGFTCLLKYTKGMFDTNKEEITIQRNNKVVSAGASVFVHSIKNQLLTNRILLKRLHHQMEQETDIKKIKAYTNKLTDQNELMLDRIEDLYRSIKTRTVHLVPVSLEEIITSSIEKFHHKYPDKNIVVDLPDDAEILADAPRLNEAITNLLTNAQEAVDEKGIKQEDGVAITSYKTRQYTVIEVRDKGIGINLHDQKKIMDPFYSTKNTNSNWGMGLYYVHSIVKEHFGILRFESKEGEGTTFFLFLPKLK